MNKLKENVQTLEGVYVHHMSYGAIFVAGEVGEVVTLMANMYGK
jgi:hypothetical protein